jgi:hypothetical protein
MENKWITTQILYLVPGAHYSLVGAGSISAVSIWSSQIRFTLANLTIINLRSVRLTLFKVIFYEIFDVHNIPIDFERNVAPIAFSP